MITLLVTIVLSFAPAPAPRATHHRPELGPCKYSMRPGLPCPREPRR